MNGMVLLSTFPWDSEIWVRSNTYFLRSARVICPQLLSAHSRERTEYGIVTRVQAVLRGIHTHDATT